MPNRKYPSPQEVMESCAIMLDVLDVVEETLHIQHEGAPQVTPEQIAKSRAFLKSIKTLHEEMLAILEG